MPAQTYTTQDYMKFCEEWSADDDSDMKEFSIVGAVVNRDTAINLILEVGRVVLYLNTRIRACDDKYLRVAAKFVDMLMTEHDITWKDIHNTAKED
jgi:hypothetical protein